MRKSVDSWHTFLKTRKSEGTAHQYRYNLLQFIDWFEQQDRPLETCVIEDYITEVLCHQKKSTVNVQLAALKSFFAWYALRRHIPDPAANLRLFPKGETKPQRQRFLTEDEYRAILLVVEDGVELDTVEFLANTGLRRSEFHRLTPQSINDEGTHLVVKGARGDKDREVPINTKVRDILSRNAMDRKTLRMVSYWKRTDYLWLWCQSLACRANIPGFGPNSLRHYFATMLIKRGVRLKIVSRILGHASVAMTERVYCHILPADTTGATDCLCN